VGLHPFRHINPGVGGERMKFDSRDIALMVVFASLYAVLVIVQGLSAAATVQLRFADCLIPLSALFGWPVIFGVTLGCLVGNTSTSAAFSNGAYDIAFGPLANLIAATLIFLLRNRRIIGCIIGSIVIGLTVGSYIWMIFGPPSNVFGVSLPLSWPVWVASTVSITASSLVAIAVVGYILLTVLSKSNIIEPLKSKGLKVATEGKRLHESFKFR
jgi:uncharacterized membrane protein